MVKIVTGKINSYKTTRLKKYYDMTKIGDGFIALKTMKDNLVYKYDLIQLSNGEVIPFIIRDTFDDLKKEVLYQLGPYHFYKEAFEIVEEKIEEFIIKGIEPIFLDEISLLELNDLGFSQVLKRLLDKKIDLCLVIREDLLDKVLTKFKIKNYEIIIGEE